MATTRSRKRKSFPIYLEVSLINWYDVVLVVEDPRLRLELRNSIENALLGPPLALMLCPNS
jgi:hypothetical protein